MTKVSVYSDFPDFESSILKRCWECSAIFTGGSGPLCSECSARAAISAAEKETHPNSGSYQEALSAAAGGNPRKKTTLPPTPAQLERINELKDLPEFQEHLDWLIAAINKGMLNTRGQAGILINQMKRKCGLI